MYLKIYDGAESIGGSKIYLRDSNHGIFLDFGLNFNIMAKYFKEFLQMRSTRGLNDPLEMELLPKVNIYRGDLVPSDLSLRNFERINLDAILISHAHADHFGSVEFVDFNIPIAGSSITLAIIKAISDCGNNSLGMNAFYSLNRQAGEDGRVLETLHWKKPGSLGSRPLIFIDNPTQELLEFMGSHPNEKRNFGFQSLDRSSLPFEIRDYPVDHSIYGATAYVVEGNTTVAYTGDIRVHGENGELTMRFARDARDASVLIIEGTRTSREEHRYISEEDVKNNIKKDVEEAKGLIIVDFSARNFERLKSIENISKGSRDFVVTEKDFYMLQALKKVGLDLIHPHLRVYKALKGNNKSWIKYLENDTDIKDRYVDPMEIHKNPENYILAFSLYDMPNLLDIKPEQGTYIYSSTEALSEEQSFDFITLGNWLSKFNFETRGFYIDEHGKPQFMDGYHASGHAAPEDLLKIIDIIDPDIIIPVHTTNPYWFAENFGEKTRILKNGDSMEL